MSTIVFSNQSSIFFTIFSVGSDQIQQHTEPENQSHTKSHLKPTTDVLHGKTKITPRAKHPDRTQKFIKAIQEALEVFEDQFGSLTEEVRSNAYKNFLEAYHDALTPVWNLACFANIETILATIANPQMTELAAMAQQLKSAPASSSIVKEKRKVPDLKTISTTLKDKFPSQNLLDSKVCEK